MVNVNASVLPGHFAIDPRFIICDESVSALDVSVQAQVLNLLKELQESRGLSYIFISHDLSVVKFMSDVMAVMNAGKIVEMGPAEEIYRQAEQDYTRRLIDSLPTIALTISTVARKSASPQGSALARL